MEEFIFYSVFVLWFLQLFNIFLLFLLFRQFGEIYLSTADSISRDGVAIGEKVPDHTCFSYSSGKETKWSELVKKPSLIAFVSPDCKPCQELLVQWNNIQENFTDKEVSLILVFTGDIRKAEEAIRKYQLQGEIITDSLDVSFHRFKVRVTPFAFALGRDLTVKDKGLCGTKEQLTLLGETIYERRHSK